jgi:hypothetical protein
MVSCARDGENHALLSLMHDNRRRVSNEYFSANITMNSQA